MIKKLADISLTIFLTFGTLLMIITIIFIAIIILAYIMDVKRSKTIKDKWLIEIVHFDNLENTYEAAISKEVVGIFEGTEQEVDEWIQEHDPDPSEQYEGWNKQMYPYYIRKKVINI